MSWTGKALLGAGLAAVAAALVFLASTDERFRETSSESLAPGVVGHATDADFDALVLGSSVPVLVEFYTDWCVPCQALAPLLEQVAREVPEARVVKVNAEASPALAVRYAVGAVPTLLLFKGGELAGRLQGRPSKGRLKKMLTL